MHVALIIVFVLGYAGIALESTLKINKTAIAILTGIICWILLILAEPTSSILLSEDYAAFLGLLKHKLASSAFNDLSSVELYKQFINYELSEHLSGISEVLFFLIGSMTIVELVDAHQGFQLITSHIKTNKLSTLLWTISIITFLLSSVLNNLTTAIIMVSLANKLIQNRKSRIYFAGMIIIASNAGGIWTPIGDVTSTMLWMGGQVTPLIMMKTLLIPSIICTLIPLLYFTSKLKQIEGQTEKNDIPLVKGESSISLSGRWVLLSVGVLALMSAPIFKEFTDLPPYTGMLFGLGVLWILSEVLHQHWGTVGNKEFSVMSALSRIDIPNVLFFLGILLAIDSLETMEVLTVFSNFLNTTFGDQRIIITLIGILSALVDNVPMVAGCMGMYDMNVFPTDHLIWEYLSYCAGSGGSLLIIGSAAGVAVMGMEKISFMEYARKISLITLVGYLAGCAFYLLFF